MFSEWSLIICSMPYNGKCVEWVLDKTYSFLKFCVYDWQIKNGNLKKEKKPLLEVKHVKEYNLQL